MDTNRLRRIFAGRDVVVAGLVFAILYFIKTALPLPGYFFLLLYERIFDALIAEWDETVYFAGQFVFVYGVTVLAGGISRYLRGRIGVDCRGRKPVIDVALPLAGVFTLIGVTMIGHGMPLLLQYQNWNIGAIGVSIGLGLGFLLLALGVFRYLSGYAGEHHRRPRPS